MLIGRCRVCEADCHAGLCAYVAGFGAVCPGCVQEARQVAVGPDERLGAQILRAMLPPRSAGVLVRRSCVTPRAGRYAHAPPVAVAAAPAAAVGGG